MMTVREQQVKTMANTTPGTPMVQPCDPTWIEVRLLDTDNRPIAGEHYRIKMPDQSIREGSLDEEGKVRFDGIMAGQCQICFPRIHGKEWSRL
jgi:hypothetical protein